MFQISGTHVLRIKKKYSIKAYRAKLLSSLIALYSSVYVQLSPTGSSALILRHSCLIYPSNLRYSLRSHWKEKGYFYPLFALRSSTFSFKSFPFNIFSKISKFAIYDPFFFPSFHNRNRAWLQRMNEMIKGYYFSCTRELI